MTIIQAIILGIVEGVTEFLPISSTGHLILTGKLMGLVDSDFVKSFEIAIQFGAILAVVVLYWSRFYRGSSYADKSASGKKFWNLETTAVGGIPQIAGKVFTAFLPTAVVGFLLYKILKTFLLSSPLLVVWSLALGGVALIVFEIWHKNRVQNFDDRSNSVLTYKQSFFVGVVQSLAIIPGVSRSGATIVGGLLMGINRQAIVEFSFLLAVPTMAAATAYDLYKSAGSFSFSEFHILAIGFIVSFFVAWLSIKWLLYFIKNHTFIPFGIYRIGVALIFWFLVVR